MIKYLLYLLLYFPFVSFAQINTNDFSDDISTNVTNNMTNNSIRVSSKKIPNLYSLDTLIQKLDGTVWVTSNFKKLEDLFIFFNQNQQGISISKRGSGINIPKKMYPIKFIQNGNKVNSGIFIIPSKDKILYYSFYLISPYYLAISAGYNNISPLTNLSLQNYLNDGYLLQLVY